MVIKKLKNQFKELKNNAHLILVYKEKKEWIAAVVNFILASIENNEKCIFISGEYPDELIKEVLREEDIDIEELINKGQLKFLARDNLYDSELIIENMIEVFQKEADQALEEGYGALNLTGEVGWILEYKNSFEKIINYEKKIDEDLFEKYPIKALCRYNMEIFDKSLIKNLIELHPYIVWKSKLYNNPYFINLDSFNSDNLFKKELEEWLNNISYYQEEKESYEKEIKSEKNMLNFLFNQADDALFVHGISENGFTKFEMVNEEACRILGYSREELLAMRPEDIDGNDFDEEFYKDKYNKLLKNKHLKFESEHLTKKGEKIAVENKSHFFEYKGRALILTVARDISERIDNEKKLREQYELIKEKNNNLKNLNKSFNNLIEIIKELSNYSIKNENHFLEKLFQKAFEIITEAEIGSVYKYEDGKIRYLKTEGHNKEFLNNLEITESNFNSISDVKIIKKINHDLINRLKKDSEINTDNLIALKESMIFNISSNQKLIGGIGLDIASGSNSTFSKNSFNIFKAFNVIAQSFYKIQNYEQLQGKFTKELALSLINMLEYHDQYTIGHSENVAILASDFAEHLNLDQKVISRTYWAGLVHDIGKIVIPSYILNKKDRLTGQEYEIIKNHPNWAYETLRNSKQLSDIAEYVLYHHERWDGNGYPEGKKGDSVPLISRILAIADSWDAMRSNRSYRDALSYEQALQELQKNKDKQYEAGLVSSFIEMLESENDILFSHN